jgi:hypothetical protein
MKVEVRCTFLNHNDRQGTSHTDQKLTKTCDLSWGCCPARLNLESRAGVVLSCFQSAAARQSPLSSPTQIIRLAESAARGLHDDSGSSEAESPIESFRRSPILGHIHLRSPAQQFHCVSNMRRLFGSKHSSAFIETRRANL